jgi:hypothetical protein
MPNNREMRIARNFVPQKGKQTSTELTSIKCEKPYENNIRAKQFHALLRL